MTRFKEISITTQEKIQSNKTYLGIESGSTRIKAVLIYDTFAPVASGNHDWQNRYENSVWTYSLDDITTRLQHCYAGSAGGILGMRRREVPAGVPRQRGVRRHGIHDITA